jgi:hypothetical protein
MIRTLLSLFLVAPVTAAYANCRSSWPVESFTVDPPATVGAGQNVTMTATFTVTEPINAGFLFFSLQAGSLINIEIQRPICQYLECPITAGTYSWSWIDSFPDGVSGNIVFSFRMADPSTGKGPWLCLHWSAFATGTPSNATGALIRWLYS